MKINHIKLTPSLLISLLVIVAFGISSCTKERIDAYDQQEKEYMDFALEIAPPGAYTAPTKALTDAQQNAINSAVVLVYQNNILLYHKTGTISDIDGVKKRVQVQLKTSKTETDLFDIMVIGNPPMEFNLANYVGKTKDEFKAIYNASIPLGMKWTGVFRMYGEAKQTLIKPTTNNFKIQMLRSLARIDVGAGVYNESTDTWAGLTDFVLSQVQVINTRSKFAVIPTVTVFNEGGNIKVETPTVPASSVVQGDVTKAFHYSDDITDGKYLKSSMFISESNAADKVSLIIGGSYKGGATTYYRVDMCVPSKTTPGSYDYLDILRNHLYRLSITKVTGAGYATAQDAQNSVPMNIVTTLTPIDEGDFGDVVFNESSYIMTTVSQVEIIATPDGVKSFDLFNVKAGFPSGVTATVTGPGISTPITLTNNAKTLISAVIPSGITGGEYTVAVGRLVKKIKLFVILPIAVDAHFDVLPYMNVASITIDNPQPWVTLSPNMVYNPAEQQSVTINGNAQGKAYIHFDENIATTGNPRIVKVTVKRANGTTERVAFEQRNLSGMVLGYFGGAKDNYGYTKLVAVESIEEYAVRKYDDTSIGSVRIGFLWGFNNITTGIVDSEYGKTGTIALAKRSDSGIAGPYTIYNNYAARYCYDKNRDTNGNGVIDDSEVVWYLPAKNQLLSVWVAHSAVTTPFNAAYYYWSATESGSTGNWLVYFTTGAMFNRTKDLNIAVRCLREL